jgi:N-acetylmuramoyl-L-alanine amidase
VYAYNNGFNGWTDWRLPLFNRDLSIGMSGYDVFLLQRAMVREGFAAYNPTGVFGLLTFASVRAYQKAHNISSTGFVGPLTRAKLNSTYSQLS